jgi:hypothetical protein
LQKESNNWVMRNKHYRSSCNKKVEQKWTH